VIIDALGYLPVTNWLYEGREFEPPEDFSPKTLYGFVYLIENLQNGKKYIGKKGFTFSKTRQVNKKKRRYKVSSDWEEYDGSSDDLQRDLGGYGPDAFRRTILYLCRSKGEATYLEAREQFVRDVLLRDDYYNNWISCRVRGPHIKLLKEDYQTERPLDSE